jgi:hypothetical protein
MAPYKSTGGSISLIKKIEALTYNKIQSITSREEYRLIVKNDID